MADFDTLTSSEEQSRPEEVYRFVIGVTEYLRTSSAVPVVLGTDTYDPIYILRNSTLQSIEERTRALEIEMPSDDAFAEQWKTRPPGIAASVTVIRVEKDETPTQTQTVVFKGVVRSVAFPGTGTRARVSVTSVEAAGAREIPRYSFSASCNHILYDAGCGIDQNAHKFTGTVSAEDTENSTITVPGLAAFSSKFPSGFVKPQAVEDFRQILVQSGDVLTLRIPFAESVLGQVVDCFKGCDHLIDGDCQNEYNNVIEHGGHPFVPGDNPFQNGLPL